MRVAKIERNTKETEITLKFEVDGSGISTISTGVGFFDHMMTHISKHGFFDVDLLANGDLDVDCHHTIEDIGIVFGQALNQALGDKAGITRYGAATIPMEEALVLCSIDICARPYLNFDATFTAPLLGNMQTEMFEEFFRAVCLHAGLNMHIKVFYGKNNHHIAEAMFKAFAKALDIATTIDPRIVGVLSTKGSL